MGTNTGLIKIDFTMIRIMEEGRKLKNGFRLSILPTAAMKAVFKQRPELYNAANQFTDPFYTVEVQMALGKLNDLEDEINKLKLFGVLDVSKKDALLIEEIASQISMLTDHESIEQKVEKYFSHSNKQMEIATFLFTWSILTYRAWDRAYDLCVSWKHECVSSLNPSEEEVFPFPQC
jgi:hypothetical protein